MVIGELLQVSQSISRAGADGACDHRRQRSEVCEGMENAERRGGWCWGVGNVIKVAIYKSSK